MSYFTGFGKKIEFWHQIFLLDLLTFPKIVNKWVMARHDMPLPLKWCISKLGEYTEKAEQQVIQ